VRSCLRSVALALAVLGGVAVSAPASAGSNLSETSPGVAVDWSGLYLGLHGGYGWTRQDTGLGSDLKVDGWLAGGHVGLQRQFDRWVIGVEASFTGGTMEGSTTVDTGVIGLANIKASVNDILLLTGRLGYAWQDRLFYVKGGYASADFDLRVDTIGGSYSSGSRLHGWTAGVGFERKLTHNVSIGLEYNYIDLGAKTFNFGGSTPTAPTLTAVVPPKEYCPPTARLDPDGIHTVMARLTFSLGDEPQHIPYK